MVYIKALDRKGVEYSAHSKVEQVIADDFFLFSMPRGTKEAPVQAGFPKKHQ